MRHVYQITGAVSNLAQIEITLKRVVLSPTGRQRREHLAGPNTVNPHLVLPAHARGVSCEGIDPGF